VVVREAALDCQVAALHKAGLHQALAERGQIVLNIFAACSRDVPHHRLSRLLRPRRKRPGRRRAAENREEFTPSHDQPS
jgi:hypothetical protein